MTAAPSLASADTERFVGRATELRALRAHASEATAGRGRIVFVAGDAGIGKTRLVTEALAELPRDRVVWGRCREAEGAPAFWPWTQALRGYVERTPADRLHLELGAERGELARLLPSLAPARPATTPAGAPEAARFRLFEAVGEFLHRATAGAPLGVVLDDLHWADSESLLLLRFLGSEIAGARLLVVGTYRELEMRQSAGAPRVLGDLARVSHRVTLRGLGEEETRELVHASVADLPDDGLRQLHETTEGNPFFLREAVALLRRDGWTAGGRVPIPLEVRAAVRRRLDPLPGPVRRLLAAGAVLGREFDLAHLARTASIAEADALGLLAEPLAMGVLAEAPGGPVRLRFAHALIQDTLYDDLSAAERARLHRAAGDVLEAVGIGTVDEGAIAHHYFHAVDRTALAKAAAYASRAAEAALAVLGYEEGVEHYRRALAAHETLGSPPADRLRVRLALGDAQALSGDIEAFRATFFEAVRVARELGDAEALAHAALGYARVRALQSPDPTIIGLLDEARRALGDADSPVTARVLALLATASYYTAPSNERTALSARAVAMARRLGDAETLATALTAHYHHLIGGRDVEARLAIAVEGARAGDAAGAYEMAMISRLHVVWDCLELGNVAGADRALSKTVDATERLRLAPVRPRVVVMQAVRALLAGDLDGAEALALHAGTFAGRGVQATDAAAMQAGVLFNVRRAQGRLAELAPLLAALADDPGGFVWRSALALVRAETDDLDAAARLLRELAARGFADVARDWTRLPTLVYLADVCGAVGDAGVAETIHALLLAEAPPVVMSPTACLGPSDRALGVTALVLGRTDDAIARLDGALALATRLGARIDVVRTQAALVRALATRDAAGDRARAAVLRTEALATAHAMGLGRCLVELERIELAAPAPAARRAWLRREDRDWSVGFDDETVRVRDTKGMSYLQRLLHAPGCDVHVLELAGGGENRAPAPEGAPDVEHARERLRALREELAEAEEWSDIGRAERLRDEMDELAETLAAGLGGGGTGARKPPAPEVERARLNVTRAILGVTRRIAAACPQLGRHLEASVRTGTLCRYAPDPATPVAWELS